jgi:hypothetical protein
MRMQNRSAVIVSLCVGFAGQPTILFAQDIAIYSEYVPDPNCEKPRLEDRMFLGKSTLETCEAMYKADNFTEWLCEREALFKQRTAQHLLQQNDVKWLSNVVNRKGACLDLLANEGKLGLWDRISHWWSR